MTLRASMALAVAAILLAVPVTLARPLQDGPLTSGVLHVAFGRCVALLGGANAPLRGAEGDGAARISRSPALPA